MSPTPGRAKVKTSARGASLSGTNLERAGDHNQRVALQSIRIGAARTKQDIATLTGLTVPAITNIANRLLEDGLILEAGKLQGSRGQPAMTFSINPDGCFSIGLNIDRDHITIVLLDFAGQVRARASREMAFASPEEVAAFFDETWAIFTKTRGVKASRIIGVGVAMPDDIASVDLPNRPDAYEAWNRVDVRQLLSQRHALPVTIENDAAAAALGELHFGHGMRKPSFFYILVSSGLGGGLVLEGEYFRGAQGRSGELGFLPIRSARTTACTLQDVVSLSGLNAMIGEGLATADPEQLAHAPPEVQARIDAWLDLAADLMVDPVISISSLINPQAIYVGGRLPAPLIDRLTEAVGQKLRATPQLLPMAPLKRAALATDAPAMGAAIIPIIDRFLPSRSALRNTEQG
ncbi:MULTISPECIES: ROK family protein [unclassified Caulobacter]|uniref:ROK family protein n=1 Tax=unclassified Caulobacter TaxID=2648921 RepID=UPI000D370251|nr:MULTISPECIES: ROK family protein [unclassified Caulobacter]PTS88098.1 sugar kinase [Caulobacter sp. HMWF009]PTT05097.1 sugar kinase [Caulobacter sp. HMWF025]